MLNLNFQQVEAGTTIPFGSITSDTTWTLAGSPYWVEGAVTVEEKVNLTIEPGVNVKFTKMPGIHIHVKGNLTAVGTPSQIINFTSNETSPAMKDWGNVWIYSTGNASIEYVNITYGNIGVYIFYASNVTVENSTILYCERGIKINGFGDNYVYGNTLSYNQAGVQFEDSQNASVINNTISFSTVSGIYSTGSINNKIHHNNFLNNIIQALDDSNGNIWNDTYPSGGNFWSDWSPLTPDLYNGSITPQTTGSPDYICDLQYDIDADSIDYYPLKYPFGSPPPDLELPTIKDVLVDPDPQEVFNIVNISAIISDNVMVDEVWINITKPKGGSLGNFSMEYNITVNRYYYSVSYNTIGGYNFTIWVKDLSGNWNYSYGLFTIQDSTLPTIDNVFANPSIGEIFDFVNISASILDNYALQDVWINISYPNGSQYNVSMNKGIIDEFYLNQSYDLIGDYDFTIWVNDTSNNWNYTSGSFTIMDLTPPSITNLDINPSSQDIFGFVNISSIVMDNYELFNVWINISYPNGSWINTTMNSGSGNLFFLNKSYDLKGVYGFTIWANDTSDNWNNKSGFFIIGDSIPPIISNIVTNPNIQEVFDKINISAIVWDNLELSGVWINITRLDGSFINISMNKAAGDLFYINQSFNIVGDYDFTIWSNDTSDNWNFSLGSFSIQDTTIPVIDNTAANPNNQDIFGFINLSANISDNYELYNAWINISYTNGSYQNISMIKGLGNLFYFNQSYSQIGIYGFTIWANDTSNNWNSSFGFFMIGDALPPSINNVIASPDPQEVFGDVNISAEITDNYNLFGIWINITYPDSSSFNISMDKAPGDIFYLIQSLDLIGLYNFKIWANDTNGNWNYSAGSFFIIDSTLPSLSNVVAFPSIQEVFDIVNVSIEVTDNYDLSSVWLNISYPDGSTLNSTMIEGMGNEFYRIRINDLVGVYDFIIWANDTSNNWNFTTGSFTVEDTTGPIIGNLVTDPGIQNISGFVNISADIIDNYYIFDAYINITYPNGISINVSLIKASGDSFYFNQSYDQVGIYNFSIYANDTSDNWNFEVGSFQIQDPAAPSSLANIISSYWKNNPTFEINWNASDNTGLNNITLHYRFSIDMFSWGPWTEYSYNDTVSGTSASGSFQFTAPSDGYYEFFANASDIDNHWEPNPLFAEAIAGVDTFSPVSNINPISSYWIKSSNVLIEASVMDGTSGVKEVNLWYRHSNDNFSWSSWTVFEMDNTEPFSWVFDFPSGEGYYELYSAGRDYVDNVELKSSGDLICAYDITPPVADAGENKVISTGTVIYFDGSGSIDNFDEISNYSWTIKRDSEEIGVLHGSNPEFNFIQIGNYFITLTVSDQSGNSDEDTITVLVTGDIEAPTITHSVFPSIQDVYNNLNISAKVTDNNKVFGVWIQILDSKNNVIENISMDKIDISDNYRYGNIYSIIGSYNYVIWANDTSDNWASASGSFEIRDSTPPSANAGEDLIIKVKETVNFDGSGSTDNLEIINYTWKISKDDSLIIYLYGVNPSYKFNKEGKYEIILTVTDSTGNIDEDTITVKVETTESNLCWLIILIIILIGIVIIYIIWKRQKMVKSTRIEEDSQVEPEPSEDVASEISQEKNQKNETIEE